MVLGATVAAAVVLAAQLAGKAARDAIFLQQFHVTNLPVLLAVSSALAIGTTFWFARRLSRGTPVRVVQLANVASAVVLIVEWMLLDRYPRPVAVAVYIHQMLLGPILVSGFWSVLSECFDPRTARRVVGTVGTGATVGAVLGALLAERVAAIAGTHALLPALAVLQMLAAWRLVAVGRWAAERAGAERPHVRDVAEKIAHVSLLRRLAAITVIVTIGAAFIDYLFKAAATSAVAHPDDLARLFATFHGVVGVLTAVVQWLAGRWALQTLGLARTLAMLPGAVIAFGAIATLVPGLGTFVALRGAENVVRNSLYREAYEVFYTPLLAADRRATKTVIDVGGERFGDVLGGLAVLAILALVSPPTTVLLVAALAVSAVGVIVALQAQHSYVEALERSLMARSIEIEHHAGHDRTTRTTLEMLASRSSGKLAAQPRQVRWPFQRARRRRPTPGDLTRPTFDSALRRIADLASGEAERAQRALSGDPLSHAMVSYAIPLLGRGDLHDAAAHALSAVSHSCCGQLVDALRDPQLPVAVRSRLPRLIAHAGGEVARAGLVSALADPALEVRMHAAESLARLRDRDPDVTVDDTVIFDGVRRELAADASAGDGEAATQHLATLLALVLPSEPIRTAFLGLSSDDVGLRGVALEYLENVLPEDIRERLWFQFSIEQPADMTKRPLEDILTELLHRRGAREELHETQVDLPLMLASDSGSR